MKNIISIIFLFCFLLPVVFQVGIANSADCVNINTAPKEELEKIIHIGSSRAEQIINLRTEAPFSSVDDLGRVAGIGSSRLVDIKEQGLACVDEPQPKPKPEAALESKPEAVSVSPEESIGIKYPLGVVINEILPSPIGPDTEEEWIEIFNQNDFEVDLSGWQIIDTVGSAKTYTFPQRTIIAPQGFLVLSRPTTKITLNNDGDGLNLIRPDGETAQTVNYGRAPRGESFNRTAENQWVWSKTLTPGSANVTVAAGEDLRPKESPRGTASASGNPQTLAAVGEQPPKSSNPRAIVSVALVFAIFSGTMILALRKKLKIS